MNSNRQLNPILVALDVPNATVAEALIERLAGAVGGFKIGSELFTREGPLVVQRVRDSGASVFLDLKFHDIPNTVQKAVAAAVHLDVQMLTVHAGGGLEMLEAAARSASQTAAGLGRQPPLVLAVTVLTSLDGHQLVQLGLEANVAQHVERLAQLAVRAGIGGLVCSPLELVRLRQILPESIQLVTPGIRGPQDSSGDQKRTLSAREAMEAGANWLVIGRPIYAAHDPRAAAERILDSLC